MKDVPLWLNIILSLITCGLWLFIWIPWKAYSSSKEVKLLKNKLEEVQKTHTALIDYKTADSQLSVLQEKVAKENKRLEKISSVYKSVTYSIENYYKKETFEKDIIFPEALFDFENLRPTVNLEFHSGNIKDLRKLFRENKKEISNLFLKYESQYTTKANKTIYNLMVLALEAELQNVLYNLKFSRLENAIDSIQMITSKYLLICSEGNQQISTTLNKFIRQLEYFYIEAVKIEYEYYIRKEKIREEQRILKEQARQDAEEQRLLEQQQKQIAREEEKYKNEIENLKRLLAESTDEHKRQEYQYRTAELEELLLNIEDKKEQIINLQNGTAGYVYVISNLGSFGDKTFKIGMTRRLEPQERVDELGNASVPFKFDVHSFIFSDNAVALENNIHNRLSERRVNKINPRKEFFNITIDELESLVNELDPTAEFNRTMFAEQYRQSSNTNMREIEDIISDDIIDEEFEEGAKEFASI